MTPSTQSELAYELLGQISFQLKRSSIAYQTYMDTGKTYLYARILRVCNDQLRQLLLQKSYLLSDELKDDALALVSHYDIWTEKWDQLERSLQPLAEDVFVFANDARFPKDAAARLELRFQEMKQAG